MAIVDAYARPLGALRLSVTDRCNLRCRYCMPTGSVAWLPRAEILRFDEIALLVRILADLGVTRARLTGGEPLLRRDLPSLVELLAEVDGIDDLALTTNGLLLQRVAHQLRTAGLGRITVSIDTLDRERFAAITGTDGLPRVLAGIDAALDAGLRPVKTDTVVLRGTNDDEIAALLEFAWARGIEPRLIEYMPVGGAARWSPEQAMHAPQILEVIARRFGPPTALPRDGPAPAQRYEVGSGKRFGIIAANSEPFCGTCNRVRLTANGMLFRCLHSRQALDLKTPIRSGVGAGEIAARVSDWWSLRASRGAEQRARPSPAETGDEPEMHVRGG